MNDQFDSAKGGPPRAKKKGTKVRSSPSKASGFKPRVVVFFCRWCYYAGQDPIGLARIKRPMKAKMVKLVCTARMDPTYIFKLMDQGIDGVIIFGCPPGDCRYVSGNLTAERRIGNAIDAMDHIGLVDRVRVRWVPSEHKASLNVEISDFMDHILELGPSPLAKKRDH